MFTREELQAIAEILSNYPMQGTVAAGLGAAVQEIQRILGKIQGEIHRLNVEANEEPEV